MRNPSSFLFLSYHCRGPLQYPVFEGDSQLLILPTDLLRLIGMRVNGGSKRLITCPKCGAVYELTYGRALACGGCPSNVSCGYSKCPRCGHEFPISSL